MNSIRQNINRVLSKRKPMNRSIPFLVILLFCVPSISKAQRDSTSLSRLPVAIQKEDRPLKFSLNEDGSHYFQVTFLNQVWVRLNESNPGSTVMSDPKEYTFDIGLRRTRIQMFGQITDRAFIYFQFGQNNFNAMWRGQNTNNRKVAAFFHDALCEYRISKGNQLKIGGGLTIANGLSRFSQPSIGTILALDVPVFAQTTVEQTDVFARKLSLYARGQVGKIDYRFSLSDPFPVTTSGSVPAISSNANFAAKKHEYQYQSYIMYQFWDKEAHTTPYMTGSHLGRKKILNVGAGIIYQPNAMWKKPVLDTVYQDMLLWACEAFMDTPLNKDKGTALTSYLGYFNFNYGTNYIRTQAQMNPANGVSLPASSPYFGSINGSGNGWPMFGTGNVIYAQAGYLMKKDLLGNQGTLQPYVTYQRNNYNYLKDPVNVYNLGINWLINGHKAKISFDYQNRPVFKNDLTVGKRSSSYILQYQISI